jgi:hypothetical protein
MILPNIDPPELLLQLCIFGSEQVSPNCLRIPEQWVLDLSHRVVGNRRMDYR